MGPGGEAECAGAFDGSVINDSLLNFTPGMWNIYEGNIRHLAYCFAKGMQRKQNCVLPSVLVTE